MGLQSAQKKRDNSAIFAEQERSRMRQNWWLLPIVVVTCFAYSVQVHGLPSTGAQLFATVVTAGIAGVYSLCALFLALSLFAWRGCISFVGLPWFKVCPALLKLKARTKLGRKLAFSFLVALGGGAGLLVIGLRYHIALLTCAGTLLLTHAALIPLFYSKPPAVLFLASSHHDSITLLASLDRMIRVPLYIASLLDESQSYSAESKRIMGYGTFRTTQDDWQDVVRTVASITPIIVLDTRVPTFAVTQEASLLFASELFRKTLFVAGQHRKCPALDGVSLPHGLSRRNKMIFLTATELFQEIRRRTSRRTLGA